MDHDVNAEDGVVTALKVLQVGGGEAYPLRVLTQLDLQPTRVRTVTATPCVSKRGNSSHVCGRLQHTTSPTTSETLRNSTHAATVCCCCRCCTTSLSLPTASCLGFFAANLTGREREPTYFESTCFRIKAYFRSILCNRASKYCHLLSGNYNSKPPQRRRTGQPWEIVWLSPVTTRYLKHNVRETNVHLHISSHTTATFETTNVRQEL